MWSTPSTSVLSIFYCLQIALGVRQYDSGYREKQYERYGIQRRQNEVPVIPKCAMYFTPLNTSTCADVLSQYTLTVQQFVDLNPRNGLLVYEGNCAGFRTIDALYCVRAATMPANITADGTCGSWQTGYTCPGSSYGDCCNVNGRCGSGYAYCGIGNCREGNCEDGLGFTIDGTCGALADDPKCGGKWGVCCNSNKQCGNGTSYCGADSCIAGACDFLTSISTTTTSTTTSKTTTSSYKTTTTTTSTSPSASGNPDVYRDYVNQGCWSEPPERAMTYLILAGADMTIEKCIDAAISQNYKYCGVEYGQECWADNALRVESTQLPITQCDFPCPGNSIEKCGAGGKFNLYLKGASTTTASPTTTTSVQSSTRTTATTTTGISTGNPDIYRSYVNCGCWSEPDGVRALAQQILNSVQMTIEMCIDAAIAAGYPYCGVEYGQECWAGPSLNVNSQELAISECSFACPGNANEKCGAGSKFNLYNLQTFSSTTTTTTTTTSKTTTAITTTTTTTTKTTTPSTTTKSTTTATLEESMFPSTKGTVQCVSSATPVPNAPTFTGGGTLSTGISTACQNILGGDSKWLEIGDPYTTTVQVGGSNVKFILQIKLGGFQVPKTLCISQLELLNSGCTSGGLTRGGCSYSSDYNFLTCMWQV